jgi:hypothetical protein
MHYSYWNRWELINIPKSQRLSEMRRTSIINIQEMSELATKLINRLLNASRVHWPPRFNYNDTPEEQTNLMFLLNRKSNTLRAISGHLQIHHEFPSANFCTCIFSTRQKSFAQYNHIHPSIHPPAHLEPMDGFSWNLVWTSCHQEPSFLCPLFHFLQPIIPTRRLWEPGDVGTPLTVGSWHSWHRWQTYKQYAIFVTECTTGTQRPRQICILFWFDDNKW